MAETLGAMCSEFGLEPYQQLTGRPGGTLDALIINLTVYDALMEARRRAAKKKR